MGGGERKKKRGKFERRGKVDWTFRIYSGVVNYLKRQSFNIVISPGKETEIKGHVVVSQSAVSNSRIVSAPALTSAAQARVQWPTTIEVFANGFQPRGFIRLNDLSRRANGKKQPRREVEFF